MVVGYVYMLRCADGSYYVGSHRGDDLQNRINDHNNGLYPKSYTYKRRPVECVWCESFYHHDEINDCERKLKGWSRAKKEALINGNPEMLRILSKRKPTRDRLLQENQK